MLTASLVESYSAELYEMACVPGGVAVSMLHLATRLLGNGSVEPFVPLRDETRLVWRTGGAGAPWRISLAYGLSRPEARFACACGIASWYLADDDLPVDEDAVQALGAAVLIPAAATAMHSLHLEDLMRRFEAPERVVRSRLASGALDRSNVAEFRPRFTPTPISSVRPVQIATA